MSVAQENLEPLMKTKKKKKTKEKKKRDHHFEGVEDEEL